MIIGKLQRRDAVRDDRLHRNQLQHVELARRAKQDAALVRGFARRRVRRPRGVALREVERCSVGRFVCLPARDGFGERELECLHVPRAAEQRLQCGAKRGSIEQRRRFGLVRVHRLALHELAPH